jgi:uncharacterized membrane protein
MIDARRTIHGGKLSAVSYTVNFASRWSWVMLAALLVVAAAGTLLK